MPRAVSKGWNTVAGLYNSDPKSTLFSANDLQEISNPSSPADAISIQTATLTQFYCGSDDMLTDNGCAAFVHQNEISNALLPADPVQQDAYWNILKNLYIGNRNYLIYKREEAGNDCGPCSLMRMQLINPAVLPDITQGADELNADMLNPGNTTNNSGGDGMVPPSPPPTDFTDVINAFNNASSITTNTIPGFVSSGIQSGQQSISSSDEVLDKMAQQLSGCSTAAYPFSATAFKQSINDFITNNPGAEITPVQINAALTAAGVQSLNDLCHPFLVDYTTINNYAAKAQSIKYVCKSDAYYDDFKNFLNTDLATMLCATCAGSGTISSISSSVTTHPFEAQLYNLLGAGPISVSKTILSVSLPANSGVGSLAFGQNAVQLTLSSAGNNTVSFFFPLMQLPASATTNPITAAACHNDISGTTGSQIAKNEVSLTIGSGTFVCWSDILNFSGDAAEMNANNTLTCVDMVNAIKEFNARTTSGLPADAYCTYDTHVDHPLYLRSLTSYLNFKYKRNFAIDDYQGLMTGCAVSDQIVFRKLGATMNISGITANNAYNAVKTITIPGALTTDPPLAVYNVDVQRTHQGLPWSLQLDLNGVDQKDLANVRDLIHTAAAGASATDVWLPASPPSTSQVVVYTDPSVTSISWNGNTYSSVALSFSNNYATPQTSNRFIFPITYTPGTTSPVDVANQLESPECRPHRNPLSRRQFRLCPLPPYRLLHLLAPSVP